MELSPVMSPEGLPMFSAGGKHAWRTHNYRGWVVSLEWVGRASQRPQACMVIWPESNVFVPSASQGMWVIGRRAISEFVGFNAQDKCTGGPSEHCWREARMALPMLGKDLNDQHALRSLVDTIVRFAPDLVLMPATPRSVQEDLRGRAMWEVVASNKSTGKVLSEAEV